jgi:hypothetical protein
MTAKTRWMNENVLPKPKYVVSCTILYIYVYVYIYIRLRWSRGSVLAFSTQVHGFELGRSSRIFRGEKILSTPSFGGEVKPSLPCRRFEACKRSLNLGGSRNLGKITGNFLAQSSTFRCQDLSRLCGRTGTWRRKWERLKAGESNGKLPPRTCLGCSVPEPYRSLDWALIPANPASKAEYK